MTDEPNVTETNEPLPAGLDDPRYEVKWRKKRDTPAAPATPAPEADASVASASTETVDVQELQRELDKERERVKDLQDRWQRAAADLANLRRRTEQERGEVEQFASMRLVQEILPVLDNFERAISTIPSNLGMLTWIQGVMLIQRHLEALLEQRGLIPIEAQGQSFNPHYHEAVSERDQEGVAPGTVIQEYQRGYSMHGRVIRPTLVEIAKAPAAQAPAEEPQAPSEPLPTDTPDAEQIAAETEIENPGP
jgi:molecular chaperone GrpE